MTTNLSHRRLPVKTELSQEDFELLHSQVEKIRETTQMAYVSKAPLLTLLRDYSRLIDRLELLEKYARDHGE
jgi:hypothetical protein